MSSHPWKLVSPWYRSNSVGTLGTHRSSAPIFQKYAATDFANRMVREPQESLKFTSEDFVHRITLDPDQVVTPEMWGDQSEPFKLFLDLHSRFYIVIAELHCDLPGFPNAQRDDVCEAGFVIRRRVPVVPKAAARDLALNLRERNRLKGQILKTGSQLFGTKSAKTQTLTGLIKAKAAEFSDSYRQTRFEQHQKNLEANAVEFRNLNDRYDLGLSLEGWVETDLKGVGNWQPVDETPAAMEEAVLPMYPLIADPTDDDHTARGRSLWFGVIPTGSSDTDSAGKPRFEDNVLFEARCFVRRHKAHCPKKTHETDCSGELVWSDATDSYQLASAFDLDGGSHRPMNIKLPDLNALRNQAELGPPGRGMNTRLITPEDSGMNLTTGPSMPPGGGGGGQGEICFHFFLIFFIVAYFLFQLILPIVMLVLQLWFLLTLKICIPPSIGLDAGLAVELKVQGELGVKLDAGIDVEFDGGIYSDAGLLKEKIANKIAGNAGLDADLSLEFENALAADSSMSVDDVANVFINMAADFSDDPDNPELAADRPTPERGLVYFKKVLPA